MIVFMVSPILFQTKQGWARRLRKANRLRKLTGYLLLTATGEPEYRFSSFRSEKHPLRCASTHESARPGLPVAPDARCVDGAGPRFFGKLRAGPSPGRPDPARQSAASCQSRAQRSKPAAATKFP